MRERRARLGCRSRVAGLGGVLSAGRLLEGELEQGEGGQEGEGKGKGGKGEGDGGVLLSVRFLRLFCNAAPTFGDEPGRSRRSRKIQVIQEDPGDPGRSR